VVTVLDPDGELIDSDQRAVVRHVVQDGYGADVVFSAGTTGEWDRIDNRTRQRVTQVCAEEVAKLNASLSAATGRGVEIWAGVTAPTSEETLENLDYAIACGVDAAVLAPLSIQGIADPVRFVARDVSDLLDARDCRLPIFLYDNADISAGSIAHLRTKWVKQLSRLDFVRGIKVSATRKVLGNYTKAAASFRDRGEFGIYVGNAMLIFELFRPYRRGVLGTIAEHWYRYRMQGAVPIGVVSGPANALPREWARAWQVCRAGDLERMDEMQAIVEGFREATEVAAGGRRTIACLKRALLQDGVISSAAVAPGTPDLRGPDAERFDVRYESVRESVRARLGAPWVTVAP